MKSFSKEELIAFGNYLLSPTRRKNVSPVFRYRVTHADVVNFEELLEKKKENNFLKTRT